MEIEELSTINARLERYLIEKYEFYFNFGIVSRDMVDIEGWIENAINEEERLFILWLANSVNFISRKHLVEMLRRCVEDVDQVLDDKPKIYTPVLGKNPRPTDSGNYISRILRDEIRINETEIKSHRELISITEPHNIIIYDDILGTGTQLIDTLHLKDFSLWGEQISILDAANSNSCSIYYCAPFAIKSGIERVKAELRSIVEIHTLYCMGDRHSLSSDHSVYWPKWIKEIIDIEIVLKSILERVGLESWHGFGDLSYGIAFEHGSPDFNINLLKYSNDSWNPLLFY